MSRIVDTLRVPEGLRRHRICAKCGKKFKTVERIENWDHVTRKYVRACKEPSRDASAPELAAVIQLQQDRPAAAAKTQRHAASLDEDCMVNVCSEAQPLLVEWWNVSRKSKHGAKAAWSEAAWLSSVARVAKLPAWQQVLLARAGVEHGWQALKPEYMKDELTAPTAQGRPMPKDPAMLAALEQWPSQTA